MVLHFHKGHDLSAFGDFPLEIFVEHLYYSKLRVRFWEFVSEPLSTLVPSYILGGLLGGRLSSQLALVADVKKTW